METVMNLICAIRRPAGILLCLATVVLASLTAAVPAALATPRPRPPGWNRHPPLPAHALATGAIPGWQLTLMAVTVVLLVAVVVGIAYPGPGRPVASARTHRLTHDSTQRHAGPRAQLTALARPAPDDSNHHAGPRP
jgi:hypothetical protein